MPHLSTGPQWLEEVMNDKFDDEGYTSWKARLAKSLERKMNSLPQAIAWGARCPLPCTLITPPWAGVPI